MGILGEIFKPVKKVFKETTQALGLAPTDKEIKSARTAQARAEADLKKQEERLRKSRVSAAEAAAGRLGARRRGYRSLLGRAEEGQTGLGDKLGG